MNKDLFELPFDQFQRYKMVSEFADVLRTKRKGSLSILDVGGHPGLIRDFLPEDDITVADVVPADIPHYVQTDGRTLPFDDGSFDLVCSCDTLEHVEEGRRGQFLSELIRVSQDYLLITAPFMDARTDLAEEILYGYVLKVLRVEFATLKEHLDNGLPDLERTIKTLKELGVTSDYFPSGYLYHWLPMMVVKHHLMAYPDTNELHRRVDLFYNLNFSPDDHRQPSYRQVIVGSKSGNKRPAKFAHRYQTTNDGALPVTEDLSKLEMFRLMADLLNMDLKRNVSDLVDFQKSSTNKEMEELKTALTDRDRQIEDLKKIISAQNSSLDELHTLVTRVRNFLPYRLYRKFSRQKKMP